MSSGESSQYWPCIWRAKGSSHQKDFKIFHAKAIETVLPSIPMSVSRSPSPLWTVSSKAVRAAAPRPQTGGCLFLPYSRRQARPAGSRASPASNPTRPWDDTKEIPWLRYGESRVQSHSSSASLLNSQTGRNRSLCHTCSQTRCSYK